MIVPSPARSLSELAGQGGGLGLVTGGDHDPADEARRQEGRDPATDDAVAASDEDIAGRGRFGHGRSSVSENQGHDSTRSAGWSRPWILIAKALGREATGKTSWPEVW